MLNRFFLMSSTTKKRIILVSIAIFLILATLLFLLIFHNAKKKKEEYLKKEYIAAAFSSGDDYKRYHSIDENCKYMTSTNYYLKYNSKDIPSDYTPCIYCLPTNESIELSYGKLRKLMLFNGSSSSTSTEVIDNIEKCFDAIPDNYKDTASIKEEFIFIKSQINVLHDFSTAYYTKHETAINLLYNDSYYTKWDLKKFVNSSAFKNENILKSVLLTEWKDSNGKYLQFTENENNRAILFTNLPNEKDPSKDYFYFIEGNLIGYCVQDDYSTKFNAFRIESISHDTIRVFCFKNNSYYLLKNQTDTFQEFHIINNTNDTATNVATNKTTNEVTNDSEQYAYTILDPFSQSMMSNAPGVFWAKVILSLVFTAIVYLLAPIIMVATNGKLGKKAAIIFTIINSVIVSILVNIIPAIISGDSEGMSFSPAILWGYLNYFILRDKYS